jgi:hypothetical protein
MREQEAEADMTVQHHINAHTHNIQHIKTHESVLLQATDTIKKIY